MKNVPSSRAITKAIGRGAVNALVPQIEDQSWFFDTELLVLAEKQGYRDGTGDGPPPRRPRWRSQR
jgi:hypothetical protein